MGKKLAIAMFGQKRLSREGGVEIVVKELCTRMAQNGCDVTCYNRAGHHVSGAEYDDAGKTEYEGIRQKSVPTIERRGYVGLSIATLLSQHHQVTAVDIVPEKVDLINNRKSPIQDDYIEKYLAEKELNLTATLDAKAAYADADFVVIAAPTNVYSNEEYEKNVFFMILAIVLSVGAVLSEYLIRISYFFDYFYLIGIPYSVKCYSANNTSKLSYNALIVGFAFLYWFIVYNTWNYFGVFPYLIQ